LLALCWFTWAYSANGVARQRAGGWIMGRMDHDSFSLQQVKLRAFDLSERTVRRSRRSAERRLDRWRSRAFFIAQTAITAGLAWLIARNLLGHQLPFFAPIAAIITLGISFGQRLRRGIEVAIGVAVGVAVGDLWRTFFGVGVWQIMGVCALAMSVATLLGAGQLMIIQSGVQSITVTVLASNLGYGVNRWLDAVLGCALALVVATIAPGSPLKKPGSVAASVLLEMADALHAAVLALRSQDTEAADAVLAQARAGEKGLAAFEQASTEGLAVVRQSPFRRRHLSRVTALADLAEPLDHASRNLRVLARRCAIAVWRGEDVPLRYLQLLEQLSEASTFMAGELEEQRLPTAAARDRLLRIGELSAHVEISDSLSATVILAQIRSMTSDLLELTGLSYADARELIPNMD
jgi:uncharacterized membrane protein YgaE (UPF0421/DUF939 family)